MYLLFQVPFVSEFYLSRLQFWFTLNSALLGALYWLVICFFFQYSWIAKFWWNVRLVIVTAPLMKPSCDPSIIDFCTAPVIGSYTVPRLCDLMYSPGCRLSRVDKALVGAVKSCLVSTYPGNTKQPDPSLSLPSLWGGLVIKTNASSEVLKGVLMLDIP